MDSHGSPYIWKAFIHLLVRDAGALKFFPWLPLLRPIWIQRPRHPRPGLQGWGVRNTKFAGSFVKNTGGPAFRCSSWEIFAKPKDLTWAKFSSCRVWLSEDDSQDSPVPRSQENKAKSPKSPCWLRGLRTSVLWHDVLAYVVEISLTIDYHGWIFGLFSFFIYHWYLMSSCHEIVTCFFLNEVAGWCDRYEQIGTWSCHVFGALTLELQCVTLRIDFQSQSCQVVHLALHWFRNERCA